MSSLGTFALLFLLSTLIVGAGIAVLVALGWAPLRRRLHRLHPDQRTHVLQALLAAPVVGGLLQTVVGLAPGVLGYIWPALDHCLVHGGLEHPHLCVAHVTAAGDATLGVWLVTAALAVVLLPLAFEIARWARGIRLTSALFRGSDYDPGLDAFIAPSQSPLAATDYRGRVVVSRGLLDELSHDHLHAVLHHEREHARRRDPLRLLYAALVSVGHLPWVRRALLADLALACEQACDEQAARKVGGRLVVAEALLTVERLLGRSVPRGAAVAYFAGEHLVARVESLLAPTHGLGAGLPRRPLMAAGVTASATLAHPLHHVVESLAGLLGA